MKKCTSVFGSKVMSPAAVYLIYPERHLLNKQAFLLSLPHQLGQNREAVIGSVRARGGLRRDVWRGRGRSIRYKAFFPSVLEAVIALHRVTKLTTLITPTLPPTTVPLPTKCFKTFIHKIRTGTNTTNTTIPAQYVQG